MHILSLTFHIHIDMCIYMIYIEIHACMYVKKKKKEFHSFIELAIQVKFKTSKREREEKVLTVMSRLGHGDKAWSEGEKVVSSVMLELGFG